MTDFYEPGVTYCNTEFPDVQWLFRCDMVTTHPEDGERTALGWRLWRHRWEAIAYGDDDWALARIAPCEHPKQDGS